MTLASNAAQFLLWMSVWFCALNSGLAIFRKKGELALAWTAAAFAALSAVIR